jgi:hypothetical protein
MTTHSEPRVYETVRPSSLWGSLATGVVIWSLHLIISYALVSLACERGLLQANLGAFALARWITIGLTVIAAAAVFYAGLVAYRNWRHLRRTHLANGEEPGGRFRFMAWLGVLLNGLFLLAIVVALFPLLFLPLCA